MLFGKNAVYRKSARFIRKLDRSRLGGFANDSHALFLNDLAYRTGSTQGSVQKAFASVTNTKHYDELAAIIGDNEDLMWRLDAELIFWWQKKSDTAMLKYYREHYRKGIYEDVTTFVSQFTLIYDNPDLHDFFAIGIWDVPFIERCISSGIDVELASSMRVR